MAKSRRQFLAESLRLLASGLVVPQFLARTSWALADTGDRVLVVVQLSGGNDGLNTVIPYADPNYYRLRPTLGVPRDQVRVLDASLGLHPNLEPLRQLYQEGQLTIIPGVGYPNPNRSHFRSMEIWHSAQPERMERTGWLGRYLDTLPTSGSIPALNFGDAVPRSLQGETARVTNLLSPDNFQIQTDSRYPGDRAAKLATLRNIHATPSEHAVLDYIRQTTVQTMVTIEELQRLSQGYLSSVTYPQTSFARGLQWIARMIASGQNTRIYYIAVGGFDTHAVQANQHANLLRTLAEALFAFSRDLEEQKAADRVLTMTFSEFGRRVRGNGSGGTDHGTALPMFVLGPRVRGGVSGQHPSLEDLDSNGDLRFQVDFRSVYAAVLRDWLGADPERILGGFYPAVGIL